MSMFAVPDKLAEKRLREIGAVLRKVVPPELPLGLLLFSYAAGESIFYLSHPAKSSSSEREKPMPWSFHLHRNTTPIHQGDRVETLCGILIPAVLLFWFGDEDNLDPSKSPRLCSKCRNELISMERQYEFGVTQAEEESRTKFGAAEKR